MAILKTHFKSLFNIDGISELHKVHSYTAKLIPQIPKFLIQNFSKKNETVLDPFCGSGTTLIEANILQRNAIGIDINPLAVLISKVRTNNYNLIQLSKAITEINMLVEKKIKVRKIIFPNIDYWFSPHSKKELIKIFSSIEILKNSYNKNIIDFLLVCFSSIIRKSSFADPIISKVYKSKFVIEKINNGWEPTPIKDFISNCNKYFQIIKSNKLNPNKIKLICDDVLNIDKNLKKEKGHIDLIITSPPYLSAQDYFRSYKLEVWWCNLLSSKDYYKLKNKFFGNEYVSVKIRNNSNGQKEIFEDISNKISDKNHMRGLVVWDYFHRMENFIKHSTNLLKPSGKLCLITGNSTIDGIEIPTFDVLRSIAEKNKFKLVHIYVDEIKKRNLFKNRNHTNGHIKEEIISVFEVNK